MLMHKKLTENQVVNISIANTFSLYAPVTPCKIIRKSRGAFFVVRVIGPWLSGGVI